MRSWSKLLILTVAGLLSACASTNHAATPAMNAPNTAQESTAPIADREAILAMAGDFKVTFDFRETVAFQTDYTPKEPYVTGAREIVRVIENRPDFISLQHILIVGGKKGMPLIPIKHWRQDWIYEPTSIPVYSGANTWERTAISPAERAGKWAQIVYQVDDAPRYAAIAKWSHENGVASWTSPPSPRPLPRRDATTRDDYDVIVAVNRHAITPIGWVHEQDNAKVILRGATPATLVHEIGINSYVRTSDLDATTVNNYWDKTKEFWADIRVEWQKLMDENPRFGLTVMGEPTEVYMPILTLASEVEEGKKSTEDAAREARVIIQEHVTTTPKAWPPGSLVGQGVKHSHASKK